MKRICATLIGAVVAICTHAQTPASKDPIEVGIDPVFLGSSQPRFCVPIRVTIENNGKDARGLVVVKMEGYQMRYPLDAPSQSKKTFFSYITIPGNAIGQSIDVEYQSNQGTFLAKLPPSIASPNESLAVAIHDRDGAVNFLSDRSQSSGFNQVRLTPLGATPEDAPDRAIGYLGVNSVILSEGAERMDDAQVNALREWVSAGGTLYFMGGAGSPVLRDPRWQAMLPVRTVGSPGQRLVPDFKAPVPFQTAALAPEAIVEQTLPDGTLYRAAKAYGAGLTRWVGADPVSSPLREQSITPPVLRRWLLEGSPTFRGVLSLSHDGSPYTGMPAMPGMSPITPQRDDPFDAKLPSALTLFAILSGYAAIVVLANLLILRALKRGELAWVTTPIISAIFAVVIFRFAGNLYSANLSRATQGMAFVAKGSNTAFFVGRVQMFFPRGGTYEIPIEGLQGMSEFQQQMWNPNAVNVFSALNPFDVGQIAMPRASVPNLSFQEFYGYQTIAWQGDVVATLGDVNANSAAVQATNGMNVKFSQAWVIHNGAVYELGAMEPGASVKKRAPFTMVNSEISNLAIQRIPKKGTFFMGRVVDAPVGPRLGESVQNRDDVIVVTNL